MTVCLVPFGVQFVCARVCGCVYVNFRFSDNVNLTTKLYTAPISQALTFR